MKRLVAAFLVLAGCSDSNDSAPPPCTVVGTYTMTAVKESGSCDIAADAGAQAAPEATTITISASGQGKPAYVVQIQGGTGGCFGDAIEACKVQTSCTFLETDALDPKNAEGTLQFSWTFDKGGFTGINSVSLPPGKGLPNGCAATSRATGTRR